MQALEKLKDIAHQMKGQDNHADQFPIFAIQEERRIYGDNLDHVDGVVYCYEDESNCEYIFNDLDKLKDFLVSKEGEKYSFSDFKKQEYSRVWKTTQFFFSQIAAEEYIQGIQRYHYPGNYRIFVMSAKNHEMKAVLALLNELADEEAGDVNE